MQNSDLQIMKATMEIYHLPKMTTYKIPNSHQQLQLLCMCDFCSTAQHDYNWAKVAPQVASWVRTITAECRFTQLYSGTRRWNVSQLCLIYACKIWQRFKGEVELEQSGLRIVLALGPILVFCVRSVYTMGVYTPILVCCSSQIR